MAHPRSEKTAEIMALWHSPERLTYQQIGDRVGRSRTVVQTIVKRNDRVGVVQRQIERQSAGVRRIVAQIENRYAVCVICGQEFRRRRPQGGGISKTCGPGCKDLYNRFKYLIDPNLHEKHRMYTLLAYRRDMVHIQHAIERKPSLHLWLERSLQYFLEYGFLPPPRTVGIRRENPTTQRLIQVAGEECIERWIQGVKDHYAGRPALIAKEL